LFRYQEVSMLANARYLTSLAVVDDPTEAKHDLDRVTTRKKDAAGRSCSGFNPLARPDTEIFRAVMDGEHCLRGFTNRDIRTKLQSSIHLKRCPKEPKKQSSKVSRIFRRLHAHGLIAKIPRTRRWKVTLYGRRLMGTTLYLRDSTSHAPTPHPLPDLALQIAKNSQRKNLRFGYVRRSMLLGVPESPKI